MTLTIKATGSWATTRVAVVGAILAASRAKKPATLKITGRLSEEERTGLTRIGFQP